jgi:hypothetical protein
MPTCLRYSLFRLFRYLRITAYETAHSDRVFYISPYSLPLLYLCALFTIGSPAVFPIHPYQDVIRRSIVSASFRVGSSSLWSSRDDRLQDAFAALDCDLDESSVHDVDSKEDPDAPPQQECMPSPAGEARVIRPELQLPNELLLRIIGDLRSRREYRLLANMAQMNRNSYDVVIPTLYETITISQSNQHLLRHGHSAGDDGSGIKLVTTNAEPMQGQMRYLGMARPFQDRTKEVF